MPKPRKLLFIAIALTAAGLAGPAAAAEPVLNLYSARHYQTDEALYRDFTAQTGIRVNRIEGKEDELFMRIRTEGANSPADVFLTVDAARLQMAHEAGLFAPVASSTLRRRIPAQFREPGGHWFGFSYRARVIVYRKDRIDPAHVRTYADLADPALRGKLCVRSGGHVYNRSLMAAQIAHHGEAGAEAWARGIVANLARPPKGGDTDQIRAVAAGECDVALSNHYYYARLMASTEPGDREVVRRTGLVFPDQAGRGAHVNISGGGMLKHAPNKDAAVKFLEYLASDAAQAYFADGNNEWPVVPTVRLDNPQLQAMGKFKVDKLGADALARNSAAAQRAIDRAGWK